MATKIYIELLDCGVTYDCKDIDDVQCAIIEEYDRGTVNIMTLFNNIAIHGLSASDVTYIYCNLVNKVNGDKFIQFYQPDLDAQTRKMIEDKCDTLHAYAWYDQ